jgi:hypothetical protein
LTRLQLNRVLGTSDFRVEDDVRIDIDTLTEAELIDLNNRVVARLRLLAEMRAHSKMLEFRIGDRVTFQPDDRPPIVGVLTRYNRKSVTVVTEAGERWNVSPSVLRRLDSAIVDQSVRPLRKV